MRLSVRHIMSHSRATTNISALADIISQHKILFLAIAALFTRIEDLMSAGVRFISTDFKHHQKCLPSPLRMLEELKLLRRHLLDVHIYIVNEYTGGAHVMKSLVQCFALRKAILHTIGSKAWCCSVHKWSVECVPVVLLLDSEIAAVVQATL